MDSEEKLLGLKKAYADMILNISKEAASRVLASSKRAAQCQHEARVAKEEGVRMMVRLKRMMDSKISEAEEVSMKQQMKIEELEAQLNEAEDIVKDLREELREVHAELEGVKNADLQPENEPGSFPLRDTSIVNEFYPYHQGATLLPKSQDELPVDSERMPYSQQEYKFEKCHNKVVSLRRSYAETRDLPNIILKGKAPGLYINGCTQRIRACGSLTEKGVCLSGVIDKVKDNKNCTELEGGKNAFKEPTAEAKSSKGLIKILSGVKPRHFEPYILKRKRNYRRKKVITPFFGKQPLHFRASDKFPQHSARTVPGSIKDSTPLSDNITKIAPNVSTYKDEPQMQLQDAEPSEKTPSIVEDGCVNVQKGAEATIDMFVTRKETEFLETSLSSSYEIDVEKVKIALSNPEINSYDTAKAFPNQPKKERVIKYTFQRKRKRQSLSNSHETQSLGKERKVEPPRHSLLSESSRESRRLAQVARQLISLSEKKWWQ